MSAAVLPRPGTALGPCGDRDDCIHVDCQQTHEQACTGCVICGYAIGYETRFYDGIVGTDARDIGLAHARCVESRKAS